MANTLTILALGHLISAAHRLIYIVLIRNGVVDIRRIISCQTVSPSFFDKVWCLRIITICGINLGLICALIESIITRCLLNRPQFILELHFVQICRWLTTLDFGDSFWTCNLLQKLSIFVYLLFDVILGNMIHFQGIFFWGHQLCFYLICLKLYCNLQIIWLLRIWLRFFQF